MAWPYGPDSTVSIRTILDRVSSSEYDEIPDQSIFVGDAAYKSRDIRLDSPACVSDSTVTRLGEWTYYLELAIVKELLDGYDAIDQDVLDRVTHYAIYDAFPE
ncbi:hypothetical protein GOEFS_054_00060 [Gordonia effusa NBRC 100432]|uniref:Uncharacterized protein n=1 Tax=Gordonia effusa NBRC 100432 TaxID=1077974 RepID=H0QZZ2_9ACTN|nr:hypothetical protein [Gordonia effusa]GAB18393.1 hypothetical protein GOEFS_054_00060 [Gordonia effusa NBRC 100432]